MGSKLGKNLQGRIIAIFGASSTIGSKFTQDAARRGATIFAVVRDTNKIIFAPKQTALGSISIVHADITRKRDVKRALSGRNIDTTINFAASFSADISKSRAVNVFGEKYVLDASVEFGVKRHIYISTIATLIPKLNAYRDTKLEAENTVKTAGKKHNLEWIILRYANVLGTPTWDQPFKIILPYLKVGIPKVPTDAKDAAFPYTTIDTVTKATLAALETRPNQTITVLDGETTIGDYLAVMEKVYNVKRSFLPNYLLQLLDKLCGKYFPAITGYSTAFEFLANPPMLENKTMKQELHVETKHFHKWIKKHFPQISKERYEYPI